MFYIESYGRLQIQNLGEHMGFHYLNNAKRENLMNSMVYNFSNSI